MFLNHHALNISLSWDRHRDVLERSCATTFSCLLWRLRDYRSIEKGVVAGKFPKRALRLVLEWLDLHRDELLSDWELASTHRPLHPIPPLE